MENRVCEFLRLRTWAVVGASANREKYGNRIYRLLRTYGYTVYPVNPREREIEGQPCYASLSDLPVKPEAVDLVVPPAVAAAMIKECAKIGINNVWFQPGVADDNIIQNAEALKLNYIHDTCVMVQSSKRYTLGRKLWAIIGDNESETANKAFEYLRDKGYRVHLVIAESRADLLAKLPFKPDVIAIASRASIAEAAIRECKDHGIEYIWLQQGYESEELINLALSYQLTVVHHASIMDEYPSVKACQ